MDQNSLVESITHNRIIWTYILFACMLAALLIGFVLMMFYPNNKDKTVLSFDKLNINTNSIGAVVMSFSVIFGLLGWSETPDIRTTSGPAGKSTTISGGANLAVNGVRLSAPTLSARTQLKSGTDKDKEVKALFRTAWASSPEILPASKHENASGYGSGPAITWNGKPANLHFDDIDVIRGTNGAINIKLPITSDGKKAVIFYKVSRSGNQWLFTPDEPLTPIKKTTTFIPAASTVNHH
jgi:hypothetical protein